VKVLITGVEGFVGTYLARLSTDHGDEVHGSYYDEKNKPPGAIRCNITDYQEVMSMIRSVAPDVIYHLAAQSAVGESARDPTGTYAVNVGGTHNVLEAVREIGTDCRVILVSSCAVYGDSLDSRSHCEDDPLIPGSPYAESKVLAELVGHHYFRTLGVPVVVARPCNHTGPGQSPTFALAEWAQKIVAIERAETEPPLEVGDPTVQRDYLDVRDVTEAYRLLASSGEPGEVYNISTGSPYRLEVLLRTLLSFSTLEIPFRSLWEPKGLSLSASPEKLQRLTDWTPSIPIEQTLRELLDFYRSR
jgi:GDP-4-dehydro-6-deoxy-D-mannose reductase